VTGRLSLRVVPTGQLARLLEEVPSECDTSVHALLEAPSANRTRRLHNIVTNARRASVSPGRAPVTLALRFRGPQHLLSFPAAACRTGPGRWGL
jgi:hypothetical protein